MGKRIWELDVARGILMILIMAYHLFYDLVFLFSLVELDTPFLWGLYRFCNNWLGSPFLLLSGICVTLGSRPIRRGLQVLGGGLAITVVTTGMYLLGFAGKDIIIYFGVLHCLGTCMLLWPLMKKLPAPVLLVLGITLAAVGLYIKRHIYIGFDYLAPLGLISRNFASSDYFPLLPNLGYFLVGAFVGKTLYREKKSLLPNVPPLATNYSPFVLHRQKLSARLSASPTHSGSLRICLGSDFLGGFPYEKRFSSPPVHPALFYADRRRFGTCTAGHLP